MVLTTNASAQVHFEYICRSKALHTRRTLAHAVVHAIREARVAEEMATRLDGSVLEIAMARAAICHFL